ncbi:hypothetical protein [Pseudogemmobacter sonorensis]|uniref:hypothetical protein n=1 Tax=Pseudogemmobacter sonorensis TaxID=2989681 RepID=UPI0036A69145
MGYSTPKEPFNLAEFLSQKAAPRSYRKPVWGRKSASKPTAEENAGADAGPEKRLKEEPGG